MRLAPDMIQRVEDIAASALYDYEAVGVRVQDVPFAPGPMAHRSHVWDNGDDTGEELPGVSAMRWDSINAAQRQGYYMAIMWPSLLATRGTTARTTERSSYMIRL